MIQELTKNEFYKCETLLNDQGHVEVKAVVEGNNPGRIFVDDLQSPKTGLIWLGNHDGFFFIGDEENEAFNAHINDFLNTVIFPEAKKLELNHFIAIGNHSKWDQTLERIFKQRQMQKMNQLVYQFVPGKDHDLAEPSVAQGYNVVKINQDLYENNNQSIQNIDFLRSKLLEFWSRPDDFFQKGIGYGIVYQNKLVSLCFSSFVAEHVHAFDVETLEEHQGNKLGQKVAHKVVRGCMSRDFIPYWDCMEANQPSKKIAENIGLEHYMNYFVYLFPISFSTL